MNLVQISWIEIIVTRLKQKSALHGYEPLSFQFQYQIYPTAKNSNTKFNSNCDVYKQKIRINVIVVILAYNLFKLKKTFL